MILFSIIIPLYNKQDSIKATLQSVLAQTYIDYEVVIIDDGSTDNSARVAEELTCQLGKNARIIRKDNKGVCSARNRGIQEAKYDYIALLDGDDIWHKDYLTEQVQMIKDFPDAKMWGINYAETCAGKLIRDVPTGLPKKYRGYVDNYFQIEGRISDLFHSSAVVIKKEVFEQVGGFDERIRYAEDNDMWFRIIATNRVVFYDKYLVKYQQDAENRAMNHRRELKYFLPYYVDKFQIDIYRDNTIFYKWINCWCAIHLRRYYFSHLSIDIEQAKIAVRKLDYSVVPFKYKLFFKLPYYIGAIFNMLDKLYHKS